ncbi:MAG: NitT/TauT family transport system substrate-binding protein [Candidatus Binatota bacterium]|jgi:ABC-type nitrate/sulfonate/bicarbonate transport system substrate-binding protein|nr:NitT/TauT family transport system substrate-binding protein [Candidatus Binatota bacterium]
MSRAFHRSVTGLFATIVVSTWSTGAFAEDITVSYASLGAAYMDHVVAIEKGYALEEGLNIKILRSGGGSATQTLLSGQIHFSSSAGSALSAALRGGPVKIIYTNQSRPTYKLLSNKPEIKTLQDLIGKKIAINTFGDTGHLATLLLFKKYRLDPKLFLFIAVRSEARFPAFLSGAIDAAPLSPRDIAQLGAMRVNMLADASKEIQLVWNGVAVSNKLLGDNPALVERFLRALAKGREFARRYKEPTIAMVSKYTPFSPDALLVDYDTALSSMTDEGSVSDDVLREEVLTRAELIKSPNVPDPAKLYDYSIIKRIYAELKKSWKPKL